MQTKYNDIVCLGGGIGTVNLLKGLKIYSDNITVIVSMADDGGSAGRLRRFYSIPPPGDLINCVAAMSNADPMMRELLTYRFTGNRYSSDSSLPGHKLGNLILVALTSLTGDFYKGLVEVQKIFQTSGRILPSAVEDVSIWAKTTTSEEVYGEKNIDLGKFKGKIEKLYLKPSNPTVQPEAISAIAKADLIIAGPGDLYTTLLPVLMVPQICKNILKSKAKKIFVVNVSNKLFETPQYNIADYVSAIERHCNSRIFDLFLLNNNHSFEIPRKFKKQYSYVPLSGDNLKISGKIVKKDLIDEHFPLYHDSLKLAKAILETV